MPDLVWILHRRKGSAFGISGVSASYLVPHGDCDLAAEVLAGRRLWIVLRDDVDRLLLSVKIEAVEVLIDGYYKGDFRISSNVVESIKLATDYSAATSFTTSATQGLTIGVSELSRELSDELASVVFRSEAIKLVAPDDRLLSRVEIHPLPTSTSQLIRAAIRAVVSHLTLDEVWRSGTGLRLTPFANFASALIHSRTGIRLSSKDELVLNSLDPIHTLLAAEDPTMSSNCTSVTPSWPIVDTDFSPIDPKAVCARSYVSIFPTLGGGLTAMAKTSHAEVIHQAMLKDVSEYLIARGITPRETRSIDLAYEAQGGLIIVELKSANAENLMAQASAGAFQLATYLNALAGHYDVLNGKLILHETGSVELQLLAVAVLRRLGVEALFYDPSKAWPSRVQGLPL
jgi:hypothetical protein